MLDDLRGQGRDQAIGVWFCVSLIIVAGSFPVLGKEFFVSFLRRVSFLPNAVTVVGAGSMGEAGPTSFFVSPHFPFFSFRTLLFATVPERDDSSGTLPRRKSFSVSQIHREIQIIIGSMKKTVQLRGRFFCFLGSDLFYLKLPSRSFSMAVYRAVQTRKKRYNMIIFFAHFREETFSAAKNKGKNLRE